MKGESRVEVSVLILLLAEFYPEINVNSELIGASAGCSPVVVRRLYSNLKTAGLIDTKPGAYGLHLGRDAKEISLWDICAAVKPMDAADIFGIEHPLSGTCPISGGLYDVLGEYLDDSISAMRSKLEAVSLFDIAWRLPDTYSVPVDEKLAKIRSALHEAEKQFGTSGENLQRKDLR